MPKPTAAQRWAAMISDETDDTAIDYIGAFFGEEIAITAGDVRHWAALEATNAALTARCERLVGALTSVEWAAGDPRRHRYCPSCGRARPHPPTVYQGKQRDMCIPELNHGHTTTCRLAAALGGNDGST